MSPNGLSESPRMPSEEPPPPGSRGPRANPSRIRSPSPVKGGSLPSRGSSENRGHHSRSNSGSGSSIPHTGSLRIRATSPLNPNIGGMATNIQPLEPRPSSSKQSQLRQLQSPQLNGMESDPYESRSRNIAPHSRDISLDDSEKVKSEDMESTRSTTGDQSPDEPKHSETHHDEISTTPQPLAIDANSVEELRKRLAWATTELALAQSKGYTIDKLDEEDDIADILGKNNIQVKDTRLLQALLSTRHQLSRVKDLVKDQTRSASERISEAERQRDEALSEAAYSRARLAAAQSGDEEGGLNAQNDRATELSRKLVTALSMQNELSMKVDDLTTQLSAEKKARKVVEDTATSHLSKFDDAEQRHQEGWSQLEEIRGKFKDAQRVATDERVKSVDREALASNLRIETVELKKQVAELTELVETQTHAVQAAKTAIASATQRAENAENALNAERAQRRELEREIIKLKQDLGNLEGQRSRIEDLESQLDHAREEADAARNVMLKGLDNLVARSTPSNSTLDYDGRIRSLQEHLDATKSLHTESREAHDNATQELQKAHERITALEQAQAQSVREAGNLQTRLSESLDHLNSLQEEHTIARSRMADVQRDLDASYVKHSAVKQLFSERPSTASPLRSMSDTPEFSNKLRELERQLDESQRLREEMEMSQEQVMQNLSVASKRHKDATRRQREAEDRVKKLEEELERASAPSVSGSSTADVAEATRRQLDAEKKLADSTVVFQDRLAQLEADYQSAVHYVKGTEKMIRRMKEELTKYKSQNAFLQTELHELKRQSLRGSDEELQGWESEKERLMKEIEAVQLAQKSETESAAEQIRSVQRKLDQHTEERDVLKSQLESVQKDLRVSSIRSQELEAELHRMNHYDDGKSQLENDLAVAKASSVRLEQENQLLEARALEAEEKVSLLLDQVENSVDTYRRSIVTKRTDGNSPPISPRSSSVGNRTSVALDSLAHELDQLRTHWESSTHRYRLSTASSLGHESPTARTHGLGLMPSFDFESHRTVDDSDRRVNGVHHPSESRWRDDAEVQPSRVRQVTA
jgi:chromosome segregation ATPase